MKLGQIPRHSIREPCTRWHFCAVEWAYMRGSYLYPNCSTASSVSSPMEPRSSVSPPHRFHVVFVRIDRDPGILSRLTGTSGERGEGGGGGHLHGARGLLYQTERKPDLPVSRRVGSELSVRSLLNQQLLVYESTLCAPSVWRCPCWWSSVVGEFGFVYDACHKFANIFAYGRLARYGCVNTSRRSLVEFFIACSYLAIPEIINALYGCE